MVDPRRRRQSVVVACEPYYQHRPTTRDSRASALAKKMASAPMSSKKLRVLLIPFFATSHIGPFTDLAVRLTTASADAAVEATVAVTPANLPILHSLLERHNGHAAATAVKVATYPFPAVDGLPKGVENPGKAAPGEAWRIDVAALSETVMRPAQEALIRAQSPDAVITDMHFVWNAAIANELGVPCVKFSVVGAFPALAMSHLVFAGEAAGPGAATSSSVVVPGFPEPDIRIPRTELPEFLRRHNKVAAGGDSPAERFFSSTADGFGLVVNTFSDLEQPYSEMYLRNGHVKRAYFLGPLSLRPSPSPSPAGTDDAVAAISDSQSSSQCIIDWLDSKPNRSVVYLCFGSLAPVSDVQLHELALGLEASGKAFIWVVRSEKWSPPKGWEERVGGRGKLLTAWAPQTAILGHPAVGAFVTHCGWNSVLETVAAGVPVLTWPMVFEQFITERLLTEVLRIGERLLPDGAAGVRSTRYEECAVIPAEAVARALTAFMQHGGPGDAARSRAMSLAAKARAAMAQGGSSHRDLLRLLNDLIEARGGGER